MKRVDIALGALLAVTLAALYGLCQNGCWMPGGSDDALYLSVARGMLAGPSQAADAGAVALIAPGWPTVLAGLMSISSSFWLLNLALLAMCVLAAVLWYCLLLRYARPAAAFAVALTAALLFEWHRFSYTHYTEALFFALLAGALLTAARIGERRRPWWRVALLTVLCAGFVSVRWAGLVALLPVAATAVTGRIRPRLTAPWIAVAVVVVVGAGTFWTTRAIARNRVATAERVAMDSAEGAGGDRAVQRELRRDRRIFRGVFRVPPGVYLRRFARAGHWTAPLLYPPAVMGRGGGAAGVAINLFGWAVLALFAVRAGAGLRRREWLWSAGLVYFFAFTFIWGRPVPRYLAPLAPLLILGATQGVHIVLRGERSRRRRRVSLVIAGGFVASLLAVNVAILGVHVQVARSDRFAQVSLAGEYAEVLAIADRLTGEGVAPGELAVRVRYDDPNRADENFWIRRMLTFLTASDVRVVPAPPDDVDREALGADRARAQGVRYLVVRGSDEARRVWHFRVPLGEQTNPQSWPPFYALIEATADGWRTLDLTGPSHGLRRVPHMPQRAATR